MKHLKSRKNKQQICACIYHMVKSCPIAECSGIWLPNQYSEHPFNIGYLNPGQVKACYSDISVIQIFLLFRCSLFRSQLNGSSFQTVKKFFSNFRRFICQLEIDAHLIDQKLRQHFFQSGTAEASDTLKRELLFITIKHNLSYSCSKYWVFSCGKNSTNLGHIIPYS